MALSSQNAFSRFSFYHIGPEDSPQEGSRGQKHHYLWTVLQAHNKVFFLEMKDTVRMNDIIHLEVLVSEEMHAVLF